ncbi:MAG: hypothetical protein IKN44_05475 [Bacteroidaceae bacterium]|nr:hypothetical protein [Bacteroidaceae bacterium]
MKKTLLFMAMTLMPFVGVFAQEEGEGAEPIDPPIYSKSFNAVLSDAKSLVSDSHYTTGQDALQAAISTAEADFAAIKYVEDPDETAAEAISSLNDQVVTVIRTLQEAIDAFVFGNPHVDATEKILNPSFDIDANNSKTVTSWVVTNFKQNRRDAATYGSTRRNEEGTAYSIHYFTEQWSNSSQGTLAGSGDIQQVISALPAGHYRLTADCLAHNQQYTAECEEAVGVELYANDAVREIGVTGFNDNTAIAFSVDFDIATGQDLTIGFRFADTNINWVGWDNATLYYIGDPEAYNSIVDVEKLKAAKEALAESIATATNALADESIPLYRTELQAAVTTASAFAEATDWKEVEDAKSALDEEIAEFNNKNKDFTDLKAAIESAEALLAQMTEGKKNFQAAIDAAKATLTDVAANYADKTDEATAMLTKAQADLALAESDFRIANASYANPANVITNGAMNSTDGWDILTAGANPDLHIQSADYDNFSKPFMECWVNNVPYGKENYARQTVTSLPNGEPLPAGYYVMKAAALATRQDQAELVVSGVTLKFQDQEVEVHTGNGKPENYRLYYEKPTAGGELTLGLFINENTDANWIAWDEVEVQFVGDKDQYMADYAQAVLGESMEELKKAVEAVNSFLEDVDLNGIDFETTELGFALEEAKYYIDNPTDEDASQELFEQLTADLNESLLEFATSGVKPKNGKRIDFSDFIINGEFDVEAGAEWTNEEEGGVLPGGTDCANWWFGSSGPDLTTQEFSQTVEDLPAGNYLLEVNAAIRVDMTYATDNYTAENLPNYLTLCQIYANDVRADVHPFFYEDESKGLTLEGMLAMTNDWDYRHGNGTLIDDMLKGTDYYRTYAVLTLEDVDDIKVGFRVELPGKNGQMPFIDYFRLYYYGDQEIDLGNGGEEDAIKDVKTQKTVAGATYDMQGRKVTEAQLRPGIYIRNGKKVLVK